MNLSYLSRTTTCTMLLGLGVATSTVFACLKPAPSVAVAPTNTSFPDTQGYWGQPFIQALAQRDIITGYEDNTYRPEQPVGRDEFASILHNAFSQPAERQLSRGSVYKDVPEGYWAASAIHDAYEMGFMQGYPGGEFRPKQSISRVEVLVSLARNLNLPQPNAAVNNVATAAPTPVATAQQPQNRRSTKRPWMFPLAMTGLMQPLMARPTQATAAAPAPAPAPSAPAQTAASTPAAQRPVSLTVSDYYKDAAQIPQYAIADVAQTTAAGIVVNHPDPQILNPNQAATRGEVAALIHQALVHQGKIASLPSSETASSYIVSRE
ncbi:MAG: S-layer homology domain-containing protein [Leptolyngbyaceae cyanobacterium bins.349]|nr:S-layer homology domain-containing protein [Leptolyngbyaceae cyanobacterium bins.349]